MTIRDSENKLGEKLTELLETTTVVSINKQIDGNYGITINIGAVRDSNTQDKIQEVSDSKLIKDERGNTHTLMVYIPIYNTNEITTISQLRFISDLVEAEVKRLIIDRLYDYDLSIATTQIKKLDQAIKSMEQVAVSLDGHPDADSLLADLEIAERYINKVKEILENTMIDSLRKAGDIYKEKLAQFNQNKDLTLEQIIDMEA